MGLSEHRSRFVPALISRVSGYVSRGHLDVHFQSHNQIIVQERKKNRQIMKNLLYNVLYVFKEFVSDIRACSMMLNEAKN